jgi:hypothetical protein
MSPARRNSMQIFANRGCFASVRRGFSALATPSAVYDVIVVKDATADYSEEFMHAALITNLPNYASASVSTQVSMEASEMMAAVQTAMLGGLSYTVLRDAIFTYPTAAEGLGPLLATVPARALQQPA